MAHLHDGATLADTAKVFDNTTIADDAEIIPNISDDAGLDPPTFTLQSTYDAVEDDSTITITYSPPEIDDADTIISMQFRYKPSTGNMWGDWITASAITAGSMDTATPLVAGIQFDFQMRAQSRLLGYSSPSKIMQIFSVGLPLVPTLSAMGRNQSIVIMITAPTSGGRPNGYHYRLRRRRANDNGWSNTQTVVDIGNVLTQNIDVFNENNGIENDRRHQVSVRSYNDQGQSSWTGWVEVIPTALSMLLSFGGMFFSLGSKFVSLGV